MKTPVTYYGGKQRMVNVLLKFIPPHRIYCEPFFGGGALFFAKPKSEVEIINDLNGEVINFYRVVKNKFTQLQAEVVSTLHSRELFNKARIIYQNPEMFTDVKRAWAFWTMANQGFASCLSSWGFANDNSKEKMLFYKREGFTLEYAKRLELTQIECFDALSIIKRCDCADTFFYLDPPYFNSHKGHYKNYSENDFFKLLELISSIDGKFLLSSYPSDILTEFTVREGWFSDSFYKPVAVTVNAKKIKTEVLTYNFLP